MCISYQTDMIDTPKSMTSGDSDLGHEMVDCVDKKYKRKLILQ